MTPFEIVELLSGKSTVDRRPIIKDILVQLGANQNHQNFFKNQNIIVPTTKIPYILIDAHYDALDNGGNNAVDNASGVAVLCELVRRFQSTQLKNIGVEFCFFDAEEPSLLGSREYMRHLKREDIIGVYNLDLVGFGANYMLWPVFLESEHCLELAIENSAEDYGLRTLRLPYLQSRGSDHVSFNGITSLTLIALDNEDFALMKEYRRAKFSRDWSTRCNADSILSITKLWNVADTVRDTIELIDPQTLSLTANIVYDAVLTIDKQY